jgi:hypothetical protein
MDQEFKHLLSRYVKKNFPTNLVGPLYWVYKKTVKKIILIHEIIYSNSIMMLKTHALPSSDQNNYSIPKAVAQEELNRLNNPRRFDTYIYDINVEMIMKLLENVHTEDHDSGSRSRYLHDTVAHVANAYPEPLPKTTLYIRGYRLGINPGYSFDVVRIKDFVNNLRSYPEVYGFDIIHPEVELMRIGCEQVADDISNTSLLDILIHVYESEDYREYKNIPEEHVQSEDKGV